jgi:Ca2+-binding EF-hand superfamily protein
MQEAIKQWGHKIPPEEVGNIMAAADVDGDGFIDYNEFVAATINVNQLEKEDLIYKAFQEFDEDGSNSISMEELEKARPSPTSPVQYVTFHRYVKAQICKVTWCWQECWLGCPCCMCASSSG